MPFNNYHNYQFSYLDKKMKNIKNHIMLNFFRVPYNQEMTA